MSLTNDELLASIETPAEDDDKNVEENLNNEEDDDKNDDNNNLDDDSNDSTDNENDDENNENDKEKEEKIDKYDVKINGENKSVTLEELKSAYSLGQAGQTALKEGREMRNQAETFIKALRENPKEVLLNPELGLDLRALAEEYLADEIAFESMSEDEQELVTARETIKKYEGQNKNRESFEQQAKLDEQTKVFQAEFTESINAALTKKSLPITQSSFQKMAAYMSEALQSDDKSIQELSCDSIAELVYEDMLNEYEQMKGITKPATPEKKPNKRVIKKNKIKKDTKKPYMTTDEFDNYLDNLE